MDDEKHELIHAGNRRRLQKRHTRRKIFGKERQERFLEHLAATCNVTASMRAADIGSCAVYRQRRINPEFREAWNAALELGYARLEAALLERALRGDRRPEFRGDKEVSGPDSPEEVDWAKGLELLRHHRRGLAGEPKKGLPTPQRLPIEQVAARLVKKLKGLGVTLAAEAAAAAAEAPKREGGGGSDGDAGDGAR